MGSVNHSIINCYDKYYGRSTFDLLMAREGSGGVIFVIGAIIVL